MVASRAASFNSRPSAGELIDFAENRAALAMRGLVIAYRNEFVAAEPGQALDDL
jgi:hypothetical protein